MLQFRPVSQTAIVAFFRSLATLTHAGVSLSRSLAICIEQTGDPRLREALNGIAVELQSGRALSDAMRTRPREFSQLAAVSIEAGEQSGKLDEILVRLAAGLERDRMLGKKITAALTYPAIVLVATLSVTALLLTTTVPVFENMYEQLRVQAPPVLRILVSAGEILKPGTFIPAATGMAGLFAALTLSLRRNPHAVLAVETLRFRLPVIGAIAKKAAAAHLARLLGMLLGCGISLHAAIPIVAHATRSAQFRGSVEALHYSLFEGSAIWPALKTSGLYDPFFVQLVRVGEETGTIGEMLSRIAEYYELDVETALQQLGTALEPMLIVVLGGLVGTIAAAIFIPLYSLIGSIK
ncbi:MAG TPA: type II secretion system F family protein [Candidatus Rubrimentiphilum sp.]|nr:type II secretion system F family protein [Candidatus Rubrimentiphilum sp.]